MLSRSELPENPVALTVAAAEGVFNVITERIVGGRIRMACSCAESGVEGWCGHRLRLLCMRYDDVVGQSADDEYRFEDIVIGTPLADAADEVDLALSEFAEARRALDERSAARLADLPALAAAASRFADVARELDRALDRLRRRLAGGP
jgi:hypothetical protein